MVDKGNKDGHRQSYAGMKGVVEAEKWGRSAAQTKYGVSPPPDAKYPKDQSGPEDKGSRMVKRTAGDVSPSSWLRGGKDGGESNPCFSPTPSGKDRSGAKKTPQSKQR